MEAGNGAAGHSDEHEGPDSLSGGMHIGEVGPDLGDHKLGLGEDTHRDAHSHDDQADAEQGIDLADDLVNRDESRHEVVHQDDHQPEQGGGHQAGGAVVLEQGDDQAGGTHGKHGAHHDQQDHGENAHDVLHDLAQIDAADLGDGSAVVALRQHTGKIVVDAAGKDGAEGDPQENHGTPQGALQRAEDRAEARDVQKLYQKQLPLRHDHVVHAVIDPDSGGLPVIRAEGFVHQLAIGEVTHHQQSQTKQER